MLFHNKKQQGLHQKVRSKYLRVGITQRLDLSSGYEEWRDSLDQRWFQFWESPEIMLLPIPNSIKNVEDWLEYQMIDAVIFSGGGDINIEYVKKLVQNTPNASLTSDDSNCSRERTEILIFQYCSSKKIPMIGVCRGAQFLNVICGGDIKLLNGHVSTKHSITSSVSKKFDEYVSLLPVTVNSYHRFGIPLEHLSKELTPIAKCDNTIEAFVSNESLMLGVMWHPERDTLLGQNTIKLFEHHLYRLKNQI